MTNYTTFPVWRCQTGFTIKFSEDRYSWSDDTKNQRMYLLTSNYVNGAESVYVGMLNKWMKPEEFREFCKEDNYNNLKLKFKIAVKNELMQKGDKPCPMCGSKLKLTEGRFGPFIGCTNYPNCKFTEKIKVNIE
jgi:ssDNA-binding Zn-finger/Zn-ribbon topoisomerase 1